MGGASANDRGPRPDYGAYVFVLCGNIIICRWYKLTLSDQTQATVETRVFPIHCKDLLAARPCWGGGRRIFFLPGPESALDGPACIQRRIICLSVRYTETCLKNINAFFHSDDAIYSFYCLCYIYYCIQRAGRRVYSGFCFGHIATNDWQSVSPLLKFCKSFDWPTLLKRVFKFQQLKIDGRNSFLIRGVLTLH